MCHNPCFSGNSFATKQGNKIVMEIGKVTILVLVETPLQHDNKVCTKTFKNGHNPCFSGNSFATPKGKSTRQELKSHNPCFSGNSFATSLNKMIAL